MGLVFCFKCILKFQKNPHDFMPGCLCDSPGDSDLLGDMHKQIYPPYNEETGALIERVMIKI